MYVLKTLASFPVKKEKRREMKKDGRGRGRKRAM